MCASRHYFSKKILRAPAGPGSTNMLAFPFLCKNSAVFACENPRILLMAKRQKAQEAVWPPCLLRP